MSRQAQGSASLHEASGGSENREARGQHTSSIPGPTSASTSTAGGRGSLGVTGSGSSVSSTASKSESSGSKGPGNTVRPAAHANTPGDQGIQDISQRK